MSTKKGRYGGGPVSERAHVCKKRLRSSMPFVILMHIICSVGRKGRTHIIIAILWWTTTTTVNGGSDDDSVSVTCGMYTPRINIIVARRRCTGPRQGQAIIIAPVRSDNISYCCGGSGGRRVKMFTRSASL